MKLNLPESKLKIKDTLDGTKAVYDRLRRRWVALTPEEWVRQNFVEFLIVHRGFPAGLMGNEVSLVQNGISRRCDTLVADVHGRPLMLVEYKAPSVAITQKAFDQICRYNMTMGASYLIVTNGLNHYCCHIDSARQSYTFLREVPHWSDISFLQ